MKSLQSHVGIIKKNMENADISFGAAIDFTIPYLLVFYVYRFYCHWNNYVLTVKRLVSPIRDKLFNEMEELDGVFDGNFNLVVLSLQH